MLANIIWLAVCWLFLVAVVGSIALAYWRERERKDAAETQRVMDSLLSDKTHTHELDAL